VLEDEEGDIFESSARPAGPPKRDGRAAQGGLWQRAIAPHERASCPMDSEEQGAIGSASGRHEVGGS